MKALHEQTGGYWKGSRRQVDSINMNMNDIHLVGKSESKHDYSGHITMLCTKNLEKIMRRPELVCMDVAIFFAICSYFLLLFHFLLVLLNILCLSRIWWVRWPQYFLSIKCTKPFLSMRQKILKCLKCLNSLHIKCINVDKKRYLLKLQKW